MSECLQEGAWRAYLDGELPADGMARAGEHLERCAACAALHRDLAERASRVGMLMAELADVRAPALRVAPWRPRWVWAAAGLAAAAALAAAFALAPRRHAPAVPARAALVETPPVAEPVLPIVPASAVEPIPRPRPVRRRAQPWPQYFLALDEDPIDTGTVMRVSLPSGMEADVIVDSEGRARAIRAVR